MLTYATICPRCTERSVLNFVYNDAWRGNGFVETVFRCTHCKRLSIVDLQTLGAINFQGPAAVSGDIDNIDAVTVCGIFPKPPRTDVPAGVDERVASAYKDGKELLLQSRWTPAASSFRTALDRATKVLWQKVEVNQDWPKELSPRIQALKAKLGLPDAIAQWAHQVRIVGNEIHDLDDVVEDDAKDAGHFAELFLTYTFTLPARLEAFRERREGK